VFCTLEYSAPKQKHRTRLVRCPATWNERHYFAYTQTTNITISIWVYKPLKSVCLGKVTLPVVIEELKNRNTWHTLRGSSKEPAGEICIQIGYNSPTDEEEKQRLEESFVIRRSLVLGQPIESGDEDSLDSKKGTRSLKGGGIQKTSSSSLSALKKKTLSGASFSSSSSLQKAMEKKPISSTSSSSSSSSSSTSSVLKRNQGNSSSSSSNNSSNNTITTNNNNKKVQQELPYSGSDDEDSNESNDSEESDSDDTFSLYSLNLDIPGYDPTTFIEFDEDDPQFLGSGKKTKLIAQAHANNLKEASNLLSSSEQPKRSSKNKDDEFDFQKEEEMTDSAAAGGGVDLSDWNGRFQKIIDKLRGFTYKTDHSAKMFANLDLIHLAQDFLYNAKVYGKIIISERHIDNEHKTIKKVSVGGFAGGEKYIKNNILFKVTRPLLLPLLFSSSSTPLQTVCDGQQEPFRIRSRCWSIEDGGTRVEGTTVLFRL
jgi:hypothetical protein